MDDGKPDMEEILRKARKLAAFHEGNATAAEVENATVILERMLRKYQLSRADLDAGTAGEDVVELAFETGTKTRTVWRGVLATCIAEGLECRVFSQRSRCTQRASILVIGHASDTVMVKWLFERLSVQLRRMGKAAAPMGLYGPRLRVWVTDYVYGAAIAIRERLVEERTRDVASDSRALVVMKAGAVEAYVDREIGKTPVKKTSPCRADAYLAGHRDGQTVGLRRPLEEPGQRQPLLEGVE